jgi:RNA polymerase sigma factor (sigma-70 family)
MPPPPAEGFAARFIRGPALRTQPDQRLVTLVREGYETAFEEIVRRYGKPLTRYAAAIVGSRGEDVTQDAFSKALLALRRDDAEIELRPWLFRIVRNTALNDLRDSPPTPEILAEAIAGGASPAEELERREELTDLMRRLRSLPEPQRAAIVMRELEGLSHEEIAAALGLSGGGARQAIYRARKALRDGLGMLLPLPLLRAALDATATGTPVEMATAAGAGGAAGAGVALKAATATLLVAGAVGGGVALHQGHHTAQADHKAASESRASNVPTAPAASTAPVVTSDDDSGDEGHGRGSDHGSNEPGDDHGGHRSEAGDDRGGHGGESSSPSGESGDDGGDHRDRSGGGGGSGSDDEGGDRRASSQQDSSRHGGGPGPSEAPPPPSGSGSEGPQPESSNEGAGSEGSGSGSVGEGSGDGGDDGVL